MIILFCFFYIKVQTTTPVSNVCTNDEGMQNPVFTPVVIVNGNKNSEALRPDSGIESEPLIVTTNTVKIEIGFETETELGSTKFLHPEDNNVGTFTISLVIEEGKPPVEYKNGQASIKMNDFINLRQNVLF